MVTTFVEAKKSGIRIPNAAVEQYNMKVEQANAEYDKRYEEYRKLVDANYLDLMTQSTKPEDTSARDYNLLFSNTQTQPVDSIEQIKKEFDALEKRLRNLEKWEQE